jgi:hypothetical protein
MDIIGIFRDTKFCYAREGGQGYVKMFDCTCDKRCNPCQAVKDKNRFYKKYEELEKIFQTREDIIKMLKPEFEDSQWFKDNIKE